MPDTNTIWHYTDAAGLLGILGSRPEKLPDNVVGPPTCRPSFRATAVEYLNDSRELLHGLGYIKNQLLLPRAMELDAIDYGPGDVHEIAHPREKAQFVRALCAALETVEGRTYSNHVFCYVTSFTEEPDSLGQWRGYCGGLDGFAIGIDKTQIPKTPEMKIDQVIYGDDAALAKDVVASAAGWLERLLHGSEVPESSPGMLDQCIRQLSRYATQFKHEGFREEAEWRVIHLGMSEGVSYRHRGAQLIPYTTWTLPPEAVVAVRVGPGPNQHQNYLAAQGFLHGHGYTPAAWKLEKSPTPFR